MRIAADYISNLQEKEILQIHVGIVKCLEMAGKFHCVKNQGRIDKFCSPAHAEVSFLRYSSSCVCIVKTLTEIAWKVSKTKENKRIFEAAREAF